MKKNFKLILFISIQFLVVLTIILLVLFAGKKTYTVTFDLNGGTHISGSLVQTIRYGQSATPPVVTKDGAYLLEWSEPYTKVTKDIETSAVWEYETSYGIKFEYDEKSNYCLISDVYEGISGDIYIGSFYDDMKVIGIKDGAFEGCENVTAIYLLDGIISIGDNAFRGCSSLETIVIPSTVETIGKNILEGCNKLKNLSLSFVGNSIYNNTVANIGYLFGGTDNSVVPETLREITITSDYKIPQQGLAHIPNLETVVIDGDVEVIERSAFAFCENLKTITLPETLTTIDPLAFMNCRNLTSISIPNNITELKEGIFVGCENLKIVQIGDKLKKIGRSTFQNCTKLDTFQVSKNNDFIDIKNNELYIKENKESIKYVILVEEFVGIKYLVTYCDKNGTKINEELIIENTTISGNVEGYKLNGDLYKDKELIDLYDNIVIEDIIVYGDYEKELEE